MVEFEEAHVSIRAIRDALADKYDREDISGLDEDCVLIVVAEVDQTDANDACELCGGDGVPDPEPSVDHNLIPDFIAAIQAGDIATARGLVFRVFDDTSDARAADNALRAA